MTWIDREPDWSGEMGRGWDVHDAICATTGSRPHSGLVTALVNIPWEEHSAKAAALGMKATISGAAVPWEWYVLHGISLATVPGLPPAQKRFPAATHEIMVMALDPDRCPPPEPSGPAYRWPWLDPANAVFQVVCVDDAMFTRVALMLARWLCVDPASWIEGPESPKQRSHRFGHVFRQSLEHEVTGGHT